MVGAVTVDLIRYDVQVPEGMITNLTDGKITSPTDIARGMSRQVDFG